jgi:hypothetical protein
MEPFWEQCGALLASSEMPGLDGMAAFDQTCHTTPTCDMNSMMVGLQHIQEVCCASGSCGGVYPGADTTCTMDCAAPFETFWKDCGDAIKAMGLAGSMENFFGTCMETLYPPGSCSDVCDESTFQCRLQEINSSCCRDEACRDGEITPIDCSTECALTFAPFFDECSGMIAERFEEGVVHRLGRFKEKCLDLNAMDVVEYGKNMIERGCTLDFGDGLTVLPPPPPPPVLAAWAPSGNMPICQPITCPDTEPYCAEIGEHGIGCTVHGASSLEMVDVDDLRWEIPAAASPIHIDGDLSDWDDIIYKAQTPFRPCDKIEGNSCGEDFVEFEICSVCGEGATYSGTQDHAAAMAFAWTPQVLYFAANVLDDEHQNSDESGWNGDSLVVMFTNAARVGDCDDNENCDGLCIQSDGCNSVEALQQPRAMVEYHYGLGDSGNIIACDYDSSYPDCDQSIAIVRDEAVKRTFYELAFPAAALGKDELDGGYTFGLAVLVNDRDQESEGQGGWSGWAPYANVHGGKQAENAGLATLVGDDDGHRRQLQDDDIRLLPTLSTISKDPDCPFVSVRNKINLIVRLCCANDACNTGIMPTKCSPLCAIEFHAFAASCGNMIGMWKEDLAATYHQFDQLCTSEETVDVATFVDVLAHAKCKPFSVATAIT